MYIYWPGRRCQAVGRLPGALMNRPSAKYLKCLSACGALLAIVALSVHPRLTPQASEPRSDSSENRSAWLHETPIVIVSNHDSMPIFRRRVGGNPTWQEEDYEKEHTEEAIRKLKDLGVTVVIAHFYKGFGLEAERDHMEKGKALATLVHKFGMRVGGYVGSTIAYVSSENSDPLHSRNSEPSGDS